MPTPRLRKRIDNISDAVRYVVHFGTMNKMFSRGMQGVHTAMYEIAYRLEELAGGYPYYVRRTRDGVWYVGRGHRAQYSIDESEFWMIPYPRSSYMIYAEEVA